MRDEFLQNLHWIIEINTPKLCNYNFNINLLIQIKNMKSLAIAALALLSVSVDGRSMVYGNHNQGMLNLNAPNSQTRNNGGIINIFGNGGHHDTRGNHGIISHVPYEIVRDDEIVDHELYQDELIINNRRGGRVTINNHRDDADDELFFGGSTINIDGNVGNVNIKSDTPVKHLKNIKVTHNQGQVTQTDSTGKTTVVAGKGHPVAVPDMDDSMDALNQAMHELEVMQRKGFLGK